MENEESKELVEIEQETNVIVSQANNIQISNQEEYENAVEFAKKVKEANKKITDYWKEPKANAAKVHKDICNKEKQMLEPLNVAEKIVKTKLVDYVNEQERIRLEEQIRIKKEQERLAYEELKKAEELRKQGNEIEAIITEQNAVAISEIENKVESKVENVSGMSYRTDYEIVAVNNQEVPCFMNGIEIRPVDLTLVKNLIKTSKGTIKIPGIDYKETKIASIRN